MAKKFVDVAPQDIVGGDVWPRGIAIQDGAALTLTNAVRILYDDTLSTSDLAKALERAGTRILQNEG